MRVPDRLRERVAKVEVRRSLHTYSPSRARDLAATVSAKLREAFMMIDENTNLTPQEIRKLLQACFADIKRRTDLRSPFVPETDRPDLEVEEQVRLTEGEIARLTGELTHRAFSRGTEKAAEAAMALRGLDVKLIAPEARARLFDGFTRVLIEQRRLELALLIDPLAEYQPHDTLFDTTDSDDVSKVEAIGISLENAIH